MTHAAKVAIIFAQKSVILPSVSIIIPVKNGAPFLQRAVASALGQTHPPLEVIIVDNNSTDGTAAIMANLATTHTRLQATSCAQPGAPAARNHGLRLARGEWVQFLDADDALFPTKLEQQLTDITREAAWIIGGYRNVFASGETQDNLPHPDPWKGLVFRYRIGYTGANLYHRKRLLSLGGWDETLPSNQDPELHFQLLRQQAPWQISPTVCCHYHHHGPTQISRSAPVGRHQRKVEMLERVNTFLATEQPTYWADNQAFFTGALLRAIRGLASHDLGAAAGAYQRIAKQGWSGQPDLMAPWILSAYRYFGFRPTEWLRLHLRSWVPASLKQDLKNLRR